MGEESVWANNLLMLGLNQNEAKKASSQAFVRPPVVAIASARARPHWRAPLDSDEGVLHAGLRVLSLSRWRKVGLPLVLRQESGPNFKGLPKVSGVATNYWVFLRCDWSPVSS